MVTLFGKIVAQVQQLRIVNIPRCMWSHSGPLQIVEHHVFCDASKRAFGCAHYLLCHYNNGVREASLIFAKVCLVPI